MLDISSNTLTSYLQLVNFHLFNTTAMAENLCDLSLVGVDNNPQNCDPATGKPLQTYGTQIVQVFYQDSRGDGEAADLALRTSLSTMQAAMTGTGVEQVFTLRNLAAGVVPDSSDQTLGGNDVPFGATIITGRNRTITARLQYPGASTHAAVAKVTKHGTLRSWIVDNIGYIQGPIENSTINFGAFLRPGLGQALPANYPMTISYDSIEEPAVSVTPLPYLFSAENAAATTTPTPPPTPTPGG